MELNKLKETISDRIDVPLLFDDEGAPTDGFKVVGSNSDEYQEVERKYKVLGVKKTARRGRGIDATTDNGAKELVDVLAKREDALLSACIKEIYGFTAEGKPAELNEATLAAIFTARPTWRAKVLAAIEAEQVFT